ncbi:SRPBCC domain-containing protein [Candidatus Neomarinimicrobiota bacterium]
MKLKAPFPLGAGMFVIVFIGNCGQSLDPITTEGLVDAPIDKVWAAWTTNDGLQSWLAPSAEIDLKIGGLMVTGKNTQGGLGEPQTTENRIMAFEDGKMLALRIVKTPNDFPYPKRAKQMWTVINLEERGPDKTQVRIVGMRFETDKKSLEMRAYFIGENSRTLERLQKHFASEQS